jgi:hypothetical protein
MVCPAEAEFGRLLWGREAWHSPGDSGEKDRDTDREGPSYASAHERSDCTRYSTLKSGHGTMHARAGDRVTEAVFVVMSVLPPLCWHLHFTWL